MTPSMVRCKGPSCRLRLPPVQPVRPGDPAPGAPPTPPCSSASPADQHFQQQPRRPALRYLQRRRSPRIMCRPSTRPSRSGIRWGPRSMDRPISIPCGPGERCGARPTGLPRLVVPHTSLTPAPQGIDIGRSIERGPRLIPDLEGRVDGLHIMIGPRCRWCRAGRSYRCC